MIIVFTGNGKGKTTAALGQAMRALGHGKRVLMIQFIKGDWETGEQIFPEKFRIPASSFQIIPAGKGFVYPINIISEGAKIPDGETSFSIHQRAAQKSLSLVEEAVNPPAGGKNWDLIILDEINLAVNLKLIKAADVLKILESVSMDVILTGRDAPEVFIDKADLVTEMKELKHPFKKGEPARIGMEF